MSNTHHTPRLVVYAQTHHLPNEGPAVSLLPLLDRNVKVTHVIVAAVHLNDGPHLTLNDHADTHPRFDQLWKEVGILQSRGVPVLAMLGGAARGSYDRLAGSQAEVRFLLPPIDAI